MSDQIVEKLFENRKVKRLNEADQFVINPGSTLTIDPDLGVKGPIKVIGFDGKFVMYQDADGQPGRILDTALQDLLAQGKVRGASK